MAYFYRLLLFYLNLSSGDFTNTSSHICGSWYLPTINIYQGLITLYPSDHNICHIKTIEINVAIPSAKEIRG